MPKTRDPLSAKERLFVAEFLVCRNQTQAAIAAGYSKQSAKAIASELMKKPRIHRAVEERLQALAKRAELSAQYVLEKLHDIADGPPGQERIQALKVLADYFGLRKVKVEHTGEAGGPILIVTGVPRADDKAASADH